MQKETHSDDDDDDRCEKEKERERVEKKIRWKFSISCRKGECKKKNNTQIQKI